MIPIYQLGQVVQVTIGDFTTYVVIVEHIFKHKMGFKGLLAQKSHHSISTDHLQQYSPKVVGSLGSDNHPELIREMQAAKAQHNRLWKLFDAEGHYHSDLALARIHANGVVTNRSPEVMQLESRN